jgi:hypothetical protein
MPFILLLIIYFFCLVIMADVAWWLPLLAIGMCITADHFGWFDKKDDKNEN